MVTPCSGSVKWLFHPRSTLPFCLLVSINEDKALENGSVTDGRNLSTKLEHSPWTVNLQESRLLWPLESRAEQGFLWHCWGHSQGLGWSPCHLSTQTLHRLYASHSMEKCPSSSYLVKWFTCTKIVEPGQSALDDNYIGVTSSVEITVPCQHMGQKISYS